MLPKLETHFRRDSSKYQPQTSQSKQDFMSTVIPNVCIFYSTCQTNFETGSKASGNWPCQSCTRVRQHVFTGWTSATLPSGRNSIKFAPRKSGPTSTPFTEFPLPPLPSACSNLPSSLFCNYPHPFSLLLQYITTSIFLLPHPHHKQLFGSIPTSSPLTHTLLPLSRTLQPPDSASVLQSFWLLKYFSGINKCMLKHVTNLQAFPKRSPFWTALLTTEVKTQG